MKKIQKIYRCPACEKNHSIEFDPEIAENRPRYPFSYVFLHKYEGNDENLKAAQIDVLTTLFLDAHLNIRGVETHLQEPNSDIISKDESKKIIEQLTNHIIELQEAYNNLVEKYNKLKNKL